jgi:two-component system, OmpR family, sensor histidine kinase QseC
LPRRIALAPEQNDATLTIRVANDGPSLPDDVRKRLFQRNPSVARGSGYGRSIAREHAEHNGAALELSDRVRGREFTIELQGADPVDRQIA